MEITFAGEVYFLSGESIEIPEFEKAGKVHDWRNHVGENVQKIWSSFTSDQKIAIAIDTHKEAEQEIWD